MYHHLNNYGTIAERDLVDIGATLDERIGAGDDFARSLKLFRYISVHPEMVDRPLEKDSGFEYR